MAVVADEVVVRLRAQLEDYDRKIANSTRLFGRSMEAQKRAALVAEEQIKRSTMSIGTALRASAASFGTFFGVREIGRISDAFTEFQNRLRVAGVEGQNLAKVQDALFASAQRYGVELGSLGELYSRTSVAAKELGVDQAELLRFADNVSAALKVQGGSAASAQGALLQLSQALAAGTVRAEEFNSIAEGALPILQAVAAGSDRFGGSVAKLRAAVLEGTVSSKEFFAAFQKGAATLQDRAAKATLTTSQALITLRNALTVYIGEANEASGASAALGGGIKALSENLNTVIPALAILGTALGVGFVANAIKARAAVAGVGSALLGAFGGPVGIAISAVTIALGSFAIEVANTNGLLDQTANVITDTRDAIDALGLSGRTASGSVGAVGSEAAGATPKITAFAGAVGAAAQKLHDLARARRDADIAELESRRTQLSTTYSELYQRTPAGRNAASEASEAQNPIARLLGLTPTGFIGKNVIRTFRGSREADPEIVARMTSIKQAIAEVDEALKRAKRQSVGDYANRPEIRAEAGVGATNAAAINQRRDEIAGLERQKASATGAALAEIEEEIVTRQREIRFLRQGVSEEVARAAAKREATAETKAGRDAAREGKKAETAAAKAARQAEQARLADVRAEDAYNADLRRYQAQYLDALGNTAQATELRERLQRELIDAEAAAAREDVRLKGPEGTRQYDQARVDALTKLIESTRLQQHDNVTLERQTRARQDALDLTLSSIGDQQDLLQAQASLVDTTAAQRDIALRLLDLQRQEEEARLRAIVALGSVASAAEKQAAQARLQLLPGIYGARAESIRRDTENPLERYRREAGRTSEEMNEALQRVAADGLASLNDGLTEAIVNFRSLGDVARSLVQQLATDLMALQVERYVTGPLAAALGVKKTGAEVNAVPAAPAGAPAAAQSQAAVAGLGDAATAAAQAITGSTLPALAQQVVSTVTSAATENIAATAMTQVATAGFLAAAALQAVAASQTMSQIAAIPGFASGGVIRGAGTGTSDSILARVSNGEGIVNARGMQQLGARGLEAINSGRVPRFAAGGAVAMTPPLNIQPMNMAVTAGQRRPDSTQAPAPVQIGSVNMSFPNVTNRHEARTTAGQASSALMDRIGRARRQGIR